MEIIRGKHASFIDAAQLNTLIAGRETIHIDIGTGDGRFVQHLAASDSSRFVIGIDACRENLHDSSRRASANALFVIANAQALPPELDGIARGISINFPWGSLLESLLSDDPALLAGLHRIAQPDAAIEVRLNAGALAECGWSFDEGVDQVYQVLQGQGFRLRPAVRFTPAELRTCPTTWAKRLAYGRDPRAMLLRGKCAPIGETVYDVMPSSAA